MLENFLYIGILLSGILVGLYLSKTCKEEIKNWRKRFFILSGACLIFSLGILLTQFNYKIPIAVSLFFIIAVLVTISLKSYKHKIK